MGAARAAGDPGRRPGHPRRALLRLLRRGGSLLSDMNAMSHDELNLFSTPLTSSEAMLIWLSHSHGMTYAFVRDRVVDLAVELRARFAGSVSPTAMSSGALSSGSLT